MKICRGIRLFLSSGYLLFAIVACENEKSAEGVWDLALIDNVSQPSPRRRFIFNKDGSFDGWIYSYEGVVSAAGTWRYSHVREFDRRKVIALTILKENGIPTEYESEFFLGNSLMLDEWQGGDVVVKYFKVKGN